MHRIGVVGTSWRHRRAIALGALTISREQRAERLPRLAAAIGAHELVYLATCNRVEVAFVPESSTSMTMARRRIFAELQDGGVPAGDAEHTFRVWHGEGAVEHLFLVAAGLDSARMGESEITGQVREAVDESRALGLLGVPLEHVFGEALKVARRVRPLTEGRIGRVSLADIAVRRAKERLERTPGCVALVGVSPMTRRCAQDLAEHGARVVIVNRTLERAEELAAVIGGEAMALDAFRAAPVEIEAMIVATGAGGAVFSRADLERIAARTASGESPLVIDLGVPANVAPEDAAATDVPRIGADEISTEAAADRERVLVDFSEARAVIDTALTDLRRNAAERLVGPLIAQLRQRYRRTALEGVDRLFERDLAGLGGTEREAVRRWAETLARRFAHMPSIGLRDVAFHAGAGAVEAFFQRAEPELARALHEAGESAWPGAFEPGDDGEDVA